MSLAKTDRFMAAEYLRLGGQPRDRRSDPGGIRPHDRGRSSRSPGNPACSRSAGCCRGRSSCAIPYIDALCHLQLRALRALRSGDRGGCRPQTAGAAPAADRQRHRRRPAEHRIIRSWSTAGGRRCDEGRSRRDREDGRPDRGSPDHRGPRRGHLQPLRERRGGIAARQGSDRARIACRAGRRVARSS